MRLGDQNVVFVETGLAANGRTRFERLPVAIDESVAGSFVPLEHGLEKGARVVTAGLQSLAAKM
jgi:hypothetical protein